MARGINKVILIGNLGADPEVRYTPNSVAVTNITVATSESWTDKQTNEKKELTEWHRVTIYQRLAEIAGEYLRKGSKVYIEGRLRTRKWTDQQGVERYTTEIIASELQMLDGRQEQSATQQAPAGQKPPRQRQQQSAAPQQPNYGMQLNGGYTNNASGGRNPDPTMPPDFAPPIDFDDDIPFAPIGLSCKKMLHSI